jgi:BirA family transcriptional regulator, biotin operon repressor / biotin---[acetyl-CoA-carboxylase] ligase
VRTPPARTVDRWEGEEVRALERRWELPLLEVHDVVPSTNDRIRALAAEGAAPFTTVVARGQSAGRGRQGKAWYSPAGRGLWLSLLLDGGEHTDRAGLLPILLGLAVARAIEGTDGALEVGIEWPNDLICESRKIGGILCESWEGEDGRRVAAGIGINLLQDEEELLEALGDDALRAGSIRMVAGRELSPVALAEEIIREVKRLLFRPPDALEGGTADELARRDTLRGRRVAVTPGDGGREARQGTAGGIDPGGALLLLDDLGNPRRITAGTVRAID